MIITPSVVTHDIRSIPYQKYIDTRLRELKRLRLKEVSLFLTTGNTKQREYIRKHVAASSVTSIPHIHIRNDMTEKEVGYYYDTYGTQRFTTHYEYRKNFWHWSPTLRKCIGIENNVDLSSLKGIERFGGMVIDVSHYAEYVRHNTAFKTIVDMAIDRFPVLANHASGVHPKTDEAIHWAYNKTYYTYVKQLPKKCFGPVVSLEVSNTLASQIKYISYIKRLLT